MARWRAPGRLRQRLAIEIEAEPFGPSRMAAIAGSVERTRSVSSMRSSMRRLGAGQKPS
jgi:hypothetical protein